MKSTALKKPVPGTQELRVLPAEIWTSCGGSICASSGGSKSSKEVHLAEPPSEDEADENGADEEREKSTDKEGAEDCKWAAAELDQDVLCP